MFCNHLQRKKVLNLLSQLKDRKIPVTNSLHRIGAKEFVIKTNKGNFVVNYLGEMKLEKRRK